MKFLKGRITFLHLFLLNQLILTLIVLVIVGAYGSYLVNLEQRVLKEKMDPILAREVDRINNEIQALETNVLRLKSFVEMFDFIPKSAIKNKFENYATETLGAQPTQFNAWFALGPNWSRKFFNRDAYVLTLHRNRDLSEKYVAEEFTVPGYDRDPNTEWWAMNVESHNVNFTDFYFDHGYMEQVMFTSAVGIYKDGKLEAVAGIDTLTKEIASRMSDFKLGKTGGVIVADENGRPILPLLSKDVPFIGFKFQNAKSIDDFAKMPKIGEKVFNIFGQRLQDFQGNDGETYITLARGIKGRPWNLIVYQKKSEAYAGLYRRLVALIFVVLAVYIILTGTLYLTSLVVTRRQKKDYEDLRLSRDQARAATQAKSAFLSTMSHEIRTPLNSMLGSAELLVETALTQQQHQYIETLRGAGSSLLEVLNNILDFSKIEAGKMYLEIQEFRLSDLVHEVTMLMHAPITKKGLHFEIVTPEFDRMVMGDMLRIKQVLLNLLGNAMKFTDHGKIELRVNARASADSEVLRYHFEVVDTGVGIAAENIARIFDEFSQEDSSVTRRFGGSGLGLSISRKLVKLMRGEIGCQSQQSIGSAFYFYLDLPSRALGSWPTRQAVMMPTTIVPSLEAELLEFEASKSVLLVDDMEENHQLLRAYLKKIENIKVESAYSGAECIDKYQAGSHDIIFMDVQMPRMSGLETIRIIRDIERKMGRKRTPIIVVSANNFNEDREKSLAAGADDHCGKPIPKKTVVELVCRYCLKEIAPPVIN